MVERRWIQKSIPGSEQNVQGQWIVLQNRDANSHNTCFSQDEMISAGIGFTHFAYALESQVAFKEHFYGYNAARQQWLDMQRQAGGGEPSNGDAGTIKHQHQQIEVHDYFEWVPAGSFAKSRSQNGYLGKAIVLLCS